MLHVFIGVFGNLYCKVNFGSKNKTNTHVLSLFFLLVCLNTSAQIFPVNFLAPPSLEGRKAGHLRAQPLSGSLPTAIPTINFTGNKVVGSIVRTIVNPTKESIHFRFENIAQTDSQFMADYIWDSVKNPLDTEQTKIEIAKACVRFLKSPENYVNDALIFSGQWQDSMLYKKEHSLIGRIYSTYSTQCGNNSQHAKVIQLYRTPYFKYDDFNTVTVPRHQFITTRFGNEYAITDYDVGTCGFMFNNPNSVNGFASFSDVRNDTLLINKKYLEAGKDLHPRQSLSDYREILSESPAYEEPTTIGGDPIEITGEFILPPYSQITTSATEPVFFLDSTNAVNMLAFQQGQQLIEHALNGGCIPCAIDSLGKTIQYLWGVDSSTAMLALRGSSIVLYDPVQDQGRPFTELFHYQYLRDSVPAWYLQTNSHDTLWIGANKDVKMPLLVLEANRCLVGDTFITNKAVFPLWNAGNTPDILTYKEVNYFEDGFLLPGEHLIKLSVNANLIGNFNDWHILGGDSLIISTLYTMVEQDTLTTSLPREIALKAEVKHYWTGPRKLYVSEPCQLSNMLGQIIFDLPVGETNLGWLAPGSYILSPFRKQILVR